MEKNTQKYNELESKLNIFFTELTYTFEKVDLGDDDLNYIVSIDTSGALIKLNTIDVLLYASIKLSSLCLLIENIYRFSDDEDITPFYKKINNANELANGGNFIINEKSRQIIYSSSIYCGSDFKELSINKIKLLINTSMRNLEILFNIIANQ